MTIDRKIVFALVLFVFSAVGCSDASAGEAKTYKPVDDGCECPETVEETSSEEAASSAGYARLLAEYTPYSESADGDEAVAVAFNSETDEEFNAGEALESTSLDESQAGEESANSSADGAININEADADELMELPGVGPALAERIVEYRRHRSFEEPEQLTRVEGIGPATFDEIASEVTVE